MLVKELAGEQYGHDASTERQDFYMTPKIETALNTADIDRLLAQHIGYFKGKAPESPTQGSGWVFKKVLKIELHIARYSPLKGSSYMELPPVLKAKKAIVNVKNKDQECFKWAVLSAVFPADKNTERVGKYQQHADELDWTGLTFPVALHDIGRFEMRNCLSINVYGCDVGRHGGAQPYVLRKSKLVTSKQHIDLLLLEGEKGQSHYCWIKRFSAFARQPSDHKHCKRHFCRYCVHGFPSEAKLTEHLANGCRDITDVIPQMPKAGSKESIIQFTSTDKQFKAPFVVYADFECLTKPITKAMRNPNHSFTDSYQQHEPSGFTAYVVSADGTKTYAPYQYRGENTVHEFISTLHEIRDMLHDEIKAVEPMVMSADQEREFQCATVCAMCDKPLGSDRVRDHCHLTGAYRGACHNKCNIEEGKKRTKNYTIPIFFHNLKGYDSHLIINEVGKYTSDLSAIPQNYEQFISFTFNRMKFLDSFAFCSSSLDTLVKNLYEGGTGKHNFVHSQAHCDKPEHLDLLLRKGVFPYDYMSDWSKMDETALPPIEAFYSQLSGKHISEADYQHALNVWRAFDCKTLGDYHDLYCKTDVLLLADVFESFRSMCLTYYELDPAHYYTTPNFAWDAMLKKTGVQLELLTDYDMHLMIEQGLRGGIAMISHRHAKANNPYAKETYDKTQEHSYIYYGDANNLYGHSMVQPLPRCNFQWSAERDVNKLIKRYADREDRGCFVKCDLDYPVHLHDLHNDYPLAPERKLVTEDMLSDYALNMKEALEIGRDTCEKLVPNLQSKRQYVCDVRNLKYYLQKGLVCTKVHRVITFDADRWMKPYIDFNTEKRTAAKNKFEQDFFKLLSNSCFGKTMENLRNRVQMDFVTSHESELANSRKPDTVERWLASPLYDGHVIYNENLVAVRKKKKTLLLNKPIYAGASILDLSKLHMYQFHYDVIKEQYGDRARLLFTDTDSLCYHIRCDDFYQDMMAQKDLYDLSNYPKNSPFYDPVNKKVLGKFKDECEGKPCQEFIGLRPKMYSLKVTADTEKKTAKGVPRSSQERICHADYQRCLFGTERRDQQQLTSSCAIRTHRHNITSVASKRVFGKIVNATRVPRRAKRVIPYANLPHAECTSSPSHSPN